MALWGELTPYSQLPVQPRILGCFFPGVVVVVVVVVGALRKSRSLPFAMIPIAWFARCSVLLYLDTSDA